MKPAQSNCRALQAVTSLPESRKGVKSGEVSLLRKEVNNALQGAKPPKQNIERQLKCVISDLHKDDSFNILQADKGNVTVVMDWTE